MNQINTLLGLSMRVLVRLVVATLVVLVVTMLSGVGRAQVLVPSPTPFPKELPTPEPTLPSILPPAPVPERRGPIPTLTVFVREIRVLGSTVFPAEALARSLIPTAIGRSRRKTSNRCAWP